jgi:hypothetical protein
MRASRGVGVARAARGLVLILSAPLTACVVLDHGPTDPFGREPFVEGFWTIDAFVQSTSCQFVRNEDFEARVFQNRDILQIVVEVQGFGEIRYDGFLDSDGDFTASHSTVFPRLATRDDATVDGTFGRDGRTLFATEEEIVTDLLTGRRCSVLWRWRGSRR